MKFNESGLKCWPCQCNVVLSQTYSSRGDYLWNVNCPGNVTESRGGGRGRKVEEGGRERKVEEGGGGGVTQVGRGFLTKETGISSDSNTRQSRWHTSLYASVIKKNKNKNKKQGVGYSEVIFAGVFVNFDLLSRADSHRRDNRFGA